MFRFLIASFLFIFLSLSIISCHQPIHSEEEPAVSNAITISLHTDSQLRTVWPKTWKEDIDSFTLTLLKGSETVDEITITKDISTHSFTQLTPADNYHIEVAALNSDGVVIGRGSKSEISVTESSVSKVNITVTPSLDDGNGSFKLKVAWPLDLNIAIQTVSGNVAADDQGNTYTKEFASFDEDQSYKYIHYTVDTIPAGSHLVSILLKDDNGMNRASITEIVNIYSNMQTDGEIILSAADFHDPEPTTSENGIETTINTEDPEDSEELDLTWNKAGASLMFSINSAFSDADSYQWYLNNTAISDATTSSLSITIETLTKGSNITVVTTKDGWSYSDSISITNEMLTTESWDFIQTFDTTLIPGSYGNGTYTDDTGVVWNYTMCRSDGGYSIGNSGGIMLRRGDEPSKIRAENVSGNITKFAVDVRKAYTSDDDRFIELYINDTLIKTSDVLPFTTGRDDSTLYTFEADNLNIQEPFSLELRIPADKTGNRQIVINNVRWR